MNSVLRQESMAVEDSRFPLGPFNRDAVFTPQTRRAAVEAIAVLPQHVRAAVAGLTDPQLDTPYRSGGWTVRQLIHHVADSHANAFIRTKVALTELNPTVMKFEQDAFATLPDAHLDVAISLSMLEAVHARWTVVCRSLTDADWQRPFIHPELGRLMVETHIHLYAWHGQHHTAHIANLRKRSGW
jgi:hypothetical protein